MGKARNYLKRNFKRERTSDSLSLNERSSLMSKIRSQKTKFEMNVIHALRKATKKKFDIHQKSIRGTPDIVFKRNNLCIFLDSDFWHGWQYPRWKHLLKNDFWRNKIENNRRRDKRISAYLKRNGWKVLRFWEHQINSNLDEVINIILKTMDT